MKKYALVAALLTAMGNAHAESYIPMGTTVTGHVSMFGPRAVKAEIQAPTHTDSTWDKIAARYTGCTVEGSRGPIVGDRTLVRFNVLKCEGKPGVAIDGVAVSEPDRIQGLPLSTSVGTTLSIMLLKSATAH